jgi:hypothetical protein
MRVYESGSRAVVHDMRKGRKARMLIDRSCRIKDAAATHTSRRQHPIAFLDHFVVLLDTSHADGCCARYRGEEGV